MSLKAYFYDADEKDKEVQLSKEVISSLSKSQLLWIEVRGEGDEEIRQSAQLLRLKAETVREILHPHDRPYLENYGDYLHLRVLGLAATKSRYKPVHLDLVAGENYVLTYEREDAELLVSFNKQVRGDTGIGQLTSASFITSLLSVYLDSYYDALGSIEDQIDKFDAKVLRYKPSDPDLLPSLIRLRRQVSDLRQLLMPHRTVFAGLVRPDFVTSADVDAIAHLGFLNERFERAIDSVQNARDLVLGSFNILMAQNAEYTSQVVRLLTVATVTFGMMSVIAAVLGMNFVGVFFFGTGTLGFFITIGLMALLALSALGLARFKKWL